MRRLALLGEIAPPPAADGRPWGLRRIDLDELDAIRERLAGRRVVVVTGPEERAAEGDSAAEDDAVMKSAQGTPGAATGTTLTDPAGAAAVGLAAVAAAAGTRVVLVECDLGRPRLARDLGLQQVPGLHEYLGGEAGPAAVVQTLVPAGSAAAAASAPLAFVAAGRPSDSPSALLGLERFGRMTAQLREAYELTILLGPPIEGSGSALGLVGAAAEASIAALPRHPDRRVSRSTLEALSRLGGTPLGALVVSRDQNRS